MWSEMNSSKQEDFECQRQKSNSLLFIKDSFQNLDPTNKHFEDIKIQLEKRQNFVDFSNESRNSLIHGSELAILNDLRNPEHRVLKRVSTNSDNEKKAVNWNSHYNNHNIGSHGQIITESQNMFYEKVPKSFDKLQLLDRINQTPSNLVVDEFKQTMNDPSKIFEISKFMHDLKNYYIDPSSNSIFIKISSSVEEENPLIPTQITKNLPLTDTRLIPLKIFISKIGNKIYFKLMLSIFRILQ